MEPRGSERPFFKSVVPVCFQSVRSGLSQSFSGGIPGSFSESQLDILNDLAVKALEALVTSESRNLGVSRAARARHPCSLVEGGKPAHATAGESDRNLGLSGN